MASFIAGIQDDFVGSVDNDIRINNFPGGTSEKLDEMDVRATIEGESAAATILHSRQGAFAATGRGAGADNGIGHLHRSASHKKLCEQIPSYRSTQFDNVLDPLVVDVWKTICFFL